jgi:hypothetical protein
MTYVTKFRSATGTITAVYTCPDHGEFDATMQRETNGDAPDVAPCPFADLEGAAERPPGTFGADDPGAPEIPIEEVACERMGTWTPSAAIGCRVRRVEVVRGGWEKPERKTYLDTRKLGEGQDVGEFQAERKKVWAEQRRKRVKELLR